MKKVLSGERPQIPDEIHETMRDILKKSWSVDSKDRPSFSEIFDSLCRIEFKLTRDVDATKVAEYLTSVIQWEHENLGSPLITFNVTNAGQNRRFSLSEELISAQTLFGCRLDGIIAYLTEKSGGNVHRNGVVAVTSSKPYNFNPRFAAQNVANLGDTSVFLSAYRCDDIAHARNNWICYDFKERKVVPTHYSLRSHLGCKGAHMMNWIVEQSADGQNWTEIDRKENCTGLFRKGFPLTCPVSGGVDCRFIRLVNVGKNSAGSDCMSISGWEIFGLLIE